jgi:hypothetical protein
MVEPGFCKQIFSTAALFLAGCASLFAQPGVNADAPVKIGTSYRVYPSHNNQTEVFISKSPIDQNILWVSCNTLNFIPFFVSEGIYTTINGGVSWQGNDTCTGPLLDFHGGDPGISINQDGTFILTRLGRSPFIGLYSHYSNDNGQTWSSQKVISTDDLERAAISTNVMPGTPGYGRTFAGWIKFANPFPMMVAYTDNGAQTWSTPRQLNHPTRRSAGGDVTIGPGGEVYICWAGVTETSPFKEILVGFASSVNGGADWNVTENAFPMDGITGVLPDKENIRVNGLPSIAVDVTDGPRRGWIYIVTGQKNLLPAGTDPDIILNRSTDGGQTWSAGIRVNQDAINNGKTQYFPTVHVDKTGSVNVIFYDDRNTSKDSAGVYLARSPDGGDTFREFEICNHHFKPKPIGGLGQGYQGDNIDITSTDTHLWPVWMDNSTGIYQIWTVPIDFSTLGGVDENTHTPSTMLQQNHPNPFHTTTTIRYRVTDVGYVSLKVFDVFGVQIAEPVKEIRQPGYYEVELNRDDLNTRLQSGSGFYFYQLKVNDRVETRKMIYLKGQQ